MKFTLASLFAITICCITSCKKHDFCPEPPKTESSCDLTQSVITSNYEEDPFTHSQYRKAYDANGKVTKVVAGLFQLQLLDSIAMIVKYNNNKVYLLREGNPGDTVLIATFDAMGRLSKLTEGNAPNDRFSSAEVTYTSNKLSRFKLLLTFIPGGLNLDASYDANGNITQLSEDAPSDSQGFFYTYDLNVTATEQFYSDDFLGDSYNSLFLAEAMGWLPDLEPVNKRTSSRIALGPDYDLHSATLTNHTYDADGKLLSYQVQDGGVTYTNTWTCGVETKN